MDSGRSSTEFVQTKISINYDQHHNERMAVSININLDFHNNDNIYINNIYNNFIQSYIKINPIYIQTISRLIYYKIKSIFYCIQL